tara:strand:+ start:504 stop:1049 length:546 start_codon:yes stop_codon:yes gene_type:complete
MRSDAIKQTVPQFLREAELFNKFYDVLGLQMDDLYSAMSDVKDQLNITTATWGLSYWEEMLGIEVNLSKSPEFRRSVILSKLRGVGTVTKDLIQESSKSFKNGSLAVVEHADEYRLTLRFTELNGVPPNFDDYKAFVREVIPAHLDYAFTIKYVLNKELNPFTNDYLTRHTHGELRVLDYL